jgi:RimJ/RimL family protein N-acetyltransferase
MEKQIQWATDRIVVDPLSLADAIFILELVNTEAWIRFIGNRHVYSQHEAIIYIQKILTDKNKKYWTVKLKDTNAAIGIVTLIKRDYLAHSDIGFAFLPDYFRNGYAYEATKVVLDNLTKNHSITQILATTLPDNMRSVKLLNKLGLCFDKEIDTGNEVLHVYSISI